MRQEEIIMAVRSGKDQDKALTYLYRILLIDAKRIIFNTSKLLNEDDTQDIFSESIMEFYIRAANGKFKITHEGSIKAFILKVCRNKAHTHHRRKVKLDYNLPLNYFDADDGGVSDGELEAVLREVYLVFSKHNNGLDILKLRMQGYDHKSISHMIPGYQNPNSVKNAYHRCMKEVKEIFKNHPQKAEILKMVL